MAGLKPPNFTQIPNEVLDNIHLMNESELRVLLVVCRKTFGWHKERDILSISQLKALTGLSKPGVMAGIADAINRGLLERVPAGKQSFSYRLLVSSPDQSTELTSKPTLPEPYNSPDRSLVNSPDTQNKEINKEIKGGGDTRARATPSQDRTPTSPPLGQRESDEALKQYGYDAGQRRKIYAARLPLTDQEIADLPDYVAALKRAGKRNPIGIVYNELMDGKSIPHPEDVAPTEAPLEYIYTDDGRAIPKDPERHARIQAQRKAQLAAAGYR